MLKLSAFTGFLIALVLSLAGTAAAQRYSNTQERIIYDQKGRYVNFSCWETGGNTALRGFGLLGKTPASVGTSWCPPLNRDLYNVSKFIGSGGKLERYDYTYLFSPANGGPTSTYRKYLYYDNPTWHYQEYQCSPGNLSAGVYAGGVTTHYTVPTGPNTVNIQMSIAPGIQMKWFNCSVWTTISD